MADNVAPDDAPSQLSRAVSDFKASSEAKAVDEAKARPPPPPPSLMSGPQPLNDCTGRLIQVGDLVQHRDDVSMCGKVMEMDPKGKPMVLWQSGGLSRKKRPQPASATYLRVVEPPEETDGTPGTPGAGGVDEVAQQSALTVPLPEAAGQEEAGQQSAPTAEPSPQVATSAAPEPARAVLAPAAEEEEPDENMGDLFAFPGKGEAESNKPATSEQQAAAAGEGEAEPSKPATSERQTTAAGEGEAEPSKPATSERQTTAAGEGEAEPSKPATSEQQTAAAGKGEAEPNKPATSERQTTAAGEGEAEPSKPATSEQQTAAAGEGEAEPSKPATADQQTAAAGGGGCSGCFERPESGALRACPKCGKNFPDWMVKGLPCGPSDEERTARRRLFKQLDADMTGVLSVEEAQNLPHGEGSPAYPKHLIRMAFHAAKEGTEHCDNDIEFEKLDMNHFRRLLLYMKHKLMLLHAFHMADEIPKQACLDLNGVRDVVSLLEAAGARWIEKEHLSADAIMPLLADPSSELAPFSRCADFCLRHSLHELDEDDCEDDKEEGRKLFRNRSDASASGTLSASLRRAGRPNALSSSALGSCSSPKFQAFLERQATPSRTSSGALAARGAATEASCGSDAGRPSPGAGRLHGRDGFMLSPEVSSALKRRASDKCRFCNSEEEGCVGRFCRRKLATGTPACSVQLLAGSAVNITLPGPGHYALRTTRFCGGLVGGGWASAEEACPKQTGVAEGSSVRRRLAEAKRLDVELLDNQLPTGTDAESERKRGELWKRFDSNGNGLASLAEVQAGLLRVCNLSCLRNAQPVIQRAYHAAKDASPATSTSSHDYIEKDEFQWFLKYIKHYMQLWNTFVSVDASGDRRIDRKEFAQAFKLLREAGMGDAIPEVFKDDPERIFDLVDYNRGGMILFDEFADFYLRHSLVQSDGGDESLALKHLRARKRLANGSRSSRGSAKVGPHGRAARGSSFA